MASTAKVPLPCIGTHSKTFWPLISAIRACRISLFSSIKLISREPQSWSIASLVERDVVSGPGVNNFLSIIIYILIVTSLFISSL